MEVSDTGIDIEPEYFQVSKINPLSEKGLGLGLSIVKHLEKLLGYDMQVISTLERVPSSNYLFQL